MRARWVSLAIAAIAAVVIGSVGAAPSRAAQVAASASSGGPCDIYQSAGTPCVAAHSVVRALYAGYNGPLYHVERADGAGVDVRPIVAGGIANVAPQDSLCTANTTCRITEIYDQSANHNDLVVEGRGVVDGIDGGTIEPMGTKGGPDHAALAGSLPITVGGHRAYGLDVTGQVGYRNNDAKGTAEHGAAEGAYMVTSGQHVNDQCCFDYGNTERTNADHGQASNGHMDAVNFGKLCYFKKPPCPNQGPWVAADMENSQFMGNQNGNDQQNLGIGTEFVTAMIKNQGHPDADGSELYALRGGNSQAGGLTTYYQGQMPTAGFQGGGYRPMEQEGAIVLGTGGDNSNLDVGSFFEGVMTRGYPTDQAENAVQANVVGARYAGNAGDPPSSTPLPTGPACGPPSTTQDPPSPPLTVSWAIEHTGYTSTYTVAPTGDLWESYLPDLGCDWTAQDLSAEYKIPKVDPTTEPVGIVHDGFTSVFTVDAGTGHLRESYLDQLRHPWQTHDLSLKYGTPPVRGTPTAVVHDGYVSVYSVDATDNAYGGASDLQETYLTALGQPWHTQDLSRQFQSPKVQVQTDPITVTHQGYVSVYTIAAGTHHLWETYLPHLGSPPAWAAQDLSKQFKTPATVESPYALVHSGPDGVYVSVYTIDVTNGHLDETYLPRLGLPPAWAEQDLSRNYGNASAKFYNTPPGDAPSAVYHDGYTSVYTVDRANGHVQESYLPSVGGDWSTQDLSRNYGNPTAKFYTTPPVDRAFVFSHPLASLVHSGGFTSVYSFDRSNDHLQESYLPHLGQDWSSQDFTARFGSPPVVKP